MTLKSIQDQLQIIKRDLFLTSVEKRFIRFVRAHRTQTEGTTELKLLVQMPQDPIFLVLYSSLLRSLEKKFKVKKNWINLGLSFRLIGKASFFKKNQFYERKWNALYLSMGGKVVFTYLYSWFTRDRKATQAAKIAFSKIKNKERALQIQYEGIVLGDLVYDTYLRFKPAATLDIQDPFLEVLLIDAFTAVTKAQKLLTKNRYDYVITSYCTYIQHGIMVRVALQKDTKVIASGFSDQMNKRVTRESPFHQKEHRHYKTAFEAMPKVEQDQAKLLAKEHLEKRFAGKIDFSTRYMKSSAFGAADAVSGFGFQDSDKKRIVLFLHCFFDSPHIFIDMIYSDFYEWVKSTLSFLTSVENSQKYDVYIKPHPNGLPGNEAVINELSALFQSVRVIPKETSNTSLIKQGFDLALTVYGTLGHEFPYFGIPVLNAGDNPHISFGFSSHAKNEKEYQQLLSDLQLIPKPDDTFRDEILKFYYMHNLYLFPGVLPIEENKYLLQFLTSFVSEAELNQYMDQCQQDPNYLLTLDALIFKSFTPTLEQKKTHE